MSRLTEFDPQLNDPRRGEDGGFNFICPLCRKGRLMVAVVLGPQRDGVHAHSTTVLPPNWDEMTITPSIAGEGVCTRTQRGCPGWHGHITNGEVTP